MSEIETDAQHPAKRLIKAYKTVFGMEGKMTSSQKLVWNDMVSRWKVYQPSFMPNFDNLAGSSGQIKNVVTYDPIKAAITDGAKLPILQIKAFLNTQEDKPKPTVRKS